MTKIDVVENTGVPQKLVELRVYASADGAFDLYQHDGKTYAYENGKFDRTHFQWNNAERKLTQTGISAFTGPQSQWLKMIGR